MQGGGAIHGRQGDGGCGVVVVVYFTDAKDMEGTALLLTDNKETKEVIQLSVGVMEMEKAAAPSTVGDEIEKALFSQGDEEKKEVVLFLSGAKEREGAAALSLGTKEMKNEGGDTLVGGSLEPLSKFQTCSMGNVSAYICSSCSPDGATKV